MMRNGHPRKRENTMHFDKMFELKFYRQQKKWKFTREPEIDPESEPKKEDPDTTLNHHQEVPKEVECLVSCCPKYVPETWNLKKNSASAENLGQLYEEPPEGMSRVWSLQSISGFMKSAALAPHSSENDLTSKV